MPQRVGFAPILFKQDRALSEADKPRLPFKSDYADLKVLPLGETNQRQKCIS